MKRAVVKFSWTILCLFSMSVLVWAEAESETEPLNYRGGVRNGSTTHRLNDKRLKQLLESLSEKTGFQDMGFDVDGFLTIRDHKNFMGGSEAARLLLMDAVNGSSQLVLEDHTHSSKVVFANLGKSTTYLNVRTKARIEHQSLRIDFSDFEKLMGPKAVKASFDLGITILHELVHGVRKLKDSVNEWEEIGDCERFVNTMRKELGLPERQQYVARSRNVISPLGWTVNIAELQFARTDFRNGKLKTDEYKLSWDVNRVGLGERGVVAPNWQAEANKKPEQKSSAAIQ